MRETFSTIPEEKKPTVLKSIRKKTQTHARALITAAALSLGEPGCKPDLSMEACAEQPETKISKKLPPEFLNPVFDTDPLFVTPVPGGEYTKAERKTRIKRLPNGETIFEDIGLTFYLVRKGDTISEIQEKLSRYPKYHYLKTQKNKLESFNIPAKKLIPKMWLPIPMENKDRHLSDEQFGQYCHLAIYDMLSNQTYGKEVQSLLEHIEIEELIAAMVAVAKQEAGGAPIGNFELHRWESHRKAFSFSLFHVMMEGPGIKARRKLDLTEGQLYHPRNAGKLFLAFVIEKGTREMRKRITDFFPLDREPELFAQFYNGKRWRRTNPNYVKNLLRYYAQALAMIRKETLAKKE